MIIKRSKETLVHSHPDWTANLITSIGDGGTNPITPSLSHNNLGSIQGGQAGQYYHLNSTKHSYIDQDVTSGSSPTFDGSNFTGIPAAGVTNNVSATTNITDHSIVRGHGGAKVVQGSGVIIDDSNNVSSMGTLGCGAITTSGNLTMNNNYIAIGTGYIGYDNTVSEGLCFDADGNATFTDNVGIGGVTPTEKLHVQSDGVATSIFLDSYGDYMNNQFVGRSASGSLGTPAVTLEHTILFCLSGRGWANGAFTPTTGIISIESDEEFSATAYGTRIVFDVTPIGSTTRFEAMRINPAGKVGIGTTSPSAYADLTLEGGALCIKEITTPTADTDYGKVYTKDDNKLYFQDGAGTEHEIAFA